MSAQFKIDVTEVCDILHNFNDSRARVCGRKIDMDLVSAVHAIKKPRPMPPAGFKKRPPHEAVFGAQLAMWQPKLTRTEAVRRLQATLGADRICIQQNVISSNWLMSYSSRIVDVKEKRLVVIMMAESKKDQPRVFSQFEKPRSFIRAQGTLQLLGPEFTYVDVYSFSRIANETTALIYSYPRFSDWWLREIDPPMQAVVTHLLDVKATNNPRLPPRAIATAVDMDNSQITEILRRASAAWQRTIVLVDTETTGLDKANCELLQIGATDADGTRFSRFIKPDFLYSYSDPLPAAHIHHIKVADLAGGVPIQQAVQDLIRFGNASDDRPLILISFGDFDQQVLLANAKRHACLDWFSDPNMRWGNFRELLTLAFLSGSLAWTGATLGVEEKNTHRADDDAMLLRQCFARFYHIRPFDWKELTPGEVHRCESVTAKRQVACRNRVPGWKSKCHTHQKRALIELETGAGNAANDLTPIPAPDTFPLTRIRLDQILDVLKINQYREPQYLDLVATVARQWTPQVRVEDIYHEVSRSFAPSGLETSPQNFRRWLKSQSAKSDGEQKANVIAVRRFPGTNVNIECPTEFPLLLMAPRSLEDYILQQVWKLLMVNPDDPGHTAHLVAPRFHSFFTDVSTVVKNSSASSV